MIFDAEQHPVPEFAVPAGFRITRHGPEATGAYLELRAGTGWNALPSPDFLERKVLPSGLIFCEDAAGRPVASASATAERADLAEYPQFATLGQVMSLPVCRGKKLGLAVCLEAMRVAVEAGYRYMALLTDDFRLPAIRIYLGTGWRPWLVDSDMPERWRKLCAETGFEYDSLGTYDAAASQTVPGVPACAGNDDSR